MSAIHSAAVITSNVQTRSIMRDLLSEDERPQRGAGLTDGGLASGRGCASLLCLKLWFLEPRSGASRLVNGLLVKSAPPRMQEARPAEDKAPHEGSGGMGPTAVLHSLSLLPACCSFTKFTPDQGSGSRASLSVVALLCLA